MASTLATQRDLLEHIEVIRTTASSRLDPTTRSALGQYFTPGPIARMMASLVASPSSTPRLLDAGAGIGSLTAAWIAEMCRCEHRPERVSVVMFEVDPTLVVQLRETLDACRVACDQAGIGFDAEVRQEDFVESAVAAIRGGMFSPDLLHFECAILNPPYRKISSYSRTRRLLRTVGIETSNLYTAFLALTVRLIKDGGELVAITPRSFCNGPYFRPFRHQFLGAMTLRRIHVFEARDQAFRDDEVLQENVIFRAVKGGARDWVHISSNSSPESSDTVERQVPYAHVVFPDDPDAFIRIVPSERGCDVSSRMARFTSTLDDLDVSVSTGRVVDFRATEFLRDSPGPDCVPLIYPGHFDGTGSIRWPNLAGRKPNALMLGPSTTKSVVPPGAYVLIRRFSAKEERRRIVAAMYQSDKVSPSPVAFENHLNYIHRSGAGLPVALAKGLTVFLNSTTVDQYFRQFNGHTQVNATDLRSMRYPSIQELESIGEAFEDELPGQEEIDGVVDSIIPARPWLTIWKDPSSLQLSAASPRRNAYLRFLACHAPNKTSSLR